MEKWANLDITPYEGYRFLIKKKLIDTNTKFQKAELIETYTYKKCLFLDEDLQSSELDEFIYHEALVHPALLAHNNPEHVLILGGGEGATLREILKHKSVKKVTMIDIDGEIIEFCKKYLQSYHQGSFDSPKAEIIIDDAKKYLEETKNKFDVIISDLCCPVKDSPAALLYTKEFYENLQTKLDDNGIFALQAGPGNIPELDMHTSIYKTLTTVFEQVTPFYASIPSFLTQWGFIIATNNNDKAINNYSVDEIDNLLSNRILKEKTLDFYDGITHQNIFNIAKHIRKALKEQTVIITDSSPCYL